MQKPHAVLASMVVANACKLERFEVSLVSCVAKILGLKDLKNIPDEATLAVLGMESLMAVEIKQTLERNHDVVMTVSEIRKLTFGKLKELDIGYVFDSVFEKNNRYLIIIIIIIVNFSIESSACPNTRAVQFISCSTLTQARKNSVRPCRLMFGYLNVKT